ncbi:tRNA pseudouridine(55) synthase TruB [Marinospirillum insulare]|uniref:tRNA pseudouridine synthase B n=1 Tax=Marinospirillum insulare TaxID=217169 RepID=A0ABQ6A1J8_9GAMM|nr:tRNA pseudouridine(55) synthase TruB [Marinospirillum insulare]GLR64113.1 tRNA pseudouridine synthase B [Marinospirillum insulare]
MQKKIPRKIVNGVLLLDKPLGLSSNQALQKVKWLLKAKKAGHTGNLDPLATGVLPLCFGEATKFASYGLEANKTYLTTIQLGEIRDTADAEGEVLERFPLPEMTQAKIEQVLSGFLGKQQQIPPMYSALKFQGKKLYELARAGQSIERPPRDITIFDLQLMGFTADSLTLEVSCSKGTYIRVLGEDIAKALGSGGYLSALRRTVSGSVKANELVTLQSLINLHETEGEAAVAAWLKPTDYLVKHLALHQLNEVEAAQVLNGQAIKLLDSSLTIGQNVRLYALGKDFLGLGQVQESAAGLLLQPIKIQSTAQAE